MTKNKKYNKFFFKENVRYSVWTCKARKISIQRNRVPKTPFSDSVTQQGWAWGPRARGGTSLNKNEFLKGV